MDSANDGRRRRAFFEASTEIVISMLPIVVVFLVMVYLGNPAKAFSKPELAFGAAIFFGQALVRLLTSMISPHRAVNGAKVVLFAACVLVFGLVPTLINLVVVIHGAEHESGVPVWFRIMQTFLFLVSGFVYVLVGVVTSELAIPSVRSAGLKES